MPDGASSGSRIGVQMRAVAHRSRLVTDHFRRLRLLDAAFSTAALPARAPGLAANSNQVLYCLETFRLARGELRGLQYGARDAASASRAIPSRA